MKTIFVSSTFRDMHFERDAIQEITQPRLNKLAMEYGEHISFCDLRWGINTEDLDSEEGSRKVLDVCLDEIDRCQPPMVVILGDRYGWIPDEGMTKAAAGRKRIDSEALRRQMQLEDLKISVTALEILYGALATAEKRNQALFYFREIKDTFPDDYAVEDTEHQNKLKQLKDKINKLAGGRIQSYSVHWDGSKLVGVEAFAKKLAEDIEIALRPGWEAKERLTPFERERDIHWSFIAEKNEMFSARRALVQRFCDELVQQGSNFLAIQAPSGSGKSMLFGALALKLRNEGYDVLPFMSGLTSESNDSVDILRNTIYYLEELVGWSHDRTDIGIANMNADGDGIANSKDKKKTGIDVLRERLCELCAECERTNKRVVIMVDAVDQLAADENRSNLVFIPERLSENVRFVLTCLPELNLNGRKSVALQPINDEEKREVINGILKSHNRALSDKVISQMIEAKASSNPMFLSLLVQRLLMMNRHDFFAINQSSDDMQAITKHQLEVIVNCPDSLQEMSAALLVEAGNRINEGLVRRAAEYMAISRYGLRKEDLVALLGDQWNSLDFSHFIHYMSESFILRDDGRFDYSHTCIREGWLRFCENPTEIHQQLTMYLSQLPDEDMVKVQELVYHSYQAGDQKHFVEYIADCQKRNFDNAHARRDVYNLSMMDEGAWICGILSDLSYDVGIYFSEFLSNTFGSFGTAKGLRVSKTILERNIQYLAGAEVLQKTAHTCLAVSAAYYQYANLGALQEGLLWKTRYDAYMVSVNKLYEAKTIDPNCDIRFALSLRFESLGNLHTEQEEQRRISFDFYKQAIAIREELFHENVTAQHRIALAGAYLSIGRLYALYTSNKDYIWNAVMYYERAASLLERGEEPTLLEQRAAIYHQIASVYKGENQHDANLRKSYDCYVKAIAYYKKLLWRDAPENIWLKILDCSYELGVLLLGIVKRIDEEKNQMVRFLYGQPFDLAERSDYIQEAINWFDNALSYYSKLESRELLSTSLVMTVTKTYFLMAGAYALMSDEQASRSNHYLALGKTYADETKGVLSDIQRFSVYDEILWTFSDERAGEVRQECLDRLNELLPAIKQHPDADKEAIRFLEMTMCGASKQYRKMISYIPGLIFSALKEGFSGKKKKLNSDIQNDIDHEIKAKRKHNIFVQQNSAGVALVFAVISVIGNCIVLPCRYLLQLLSPWLLNITDNAKPLANVILYYDYFAIGVSCLLLAMALYACVLAIKAKKASLRVSLVGLGLSIVAVLIVLLSFNSTNHFENSYQDAVSLMNAGKYEEAAAIFESLHDYEDSELKVEACHTAILEREYAYALNLLREGNIIEAYEKLIALNGYKDSREQANSIYSAYCTELLKSARIGDYICFGAYEQDNDTANGKERIEWLVLDIADDRILVISRYALDVQPYNTVLRDTTWESSTLRAWLNNDFLQEAFSDEDIAVIYAPAQDGIFVFSKEEAQTYFPTNDARQCEATEYAKASGASRAGCAWWLRTSGKYQNYAVHIWKNGGINESGAGVNESDIAVRPAMWIVLPG